MKKVTIITFLTLVFFTFCFAQNVGISTTTPIARLDIVNNAEQDALRVNHSGLAGLLQADGDIVDVDGISNIEFSTMPDGGYYIIVKHRNHLTVMTPGAIQMSSNFVSIHDFTAGLAYIGSTGNTPPKLISGTIHGLFAGDYNHTGAIDAADRNISWNFRNQLGYLSEDTNFDGVCDSYERSAAWNNRNIRTQVP